MRLCAWERRHADPQNPTQPATQKKKKKEKKKRKKTYDFACILANCRQKPVG